MNKRVSCLLVVLMMLFTLPGCSALQALEELRNKDKDKVDPPSDTISTEADLEEADEKEEPSGSEQDSQKEEAGDGEKASEGEKPSKKPSLNKKPSHTEEASDKKEEQTGAETPPAATPEKEPEAELQDNSLAMLQDEISQNGCMVGVSFIGYMSNSSEVELRDYIANSDNGRTYPFLNTAMLLTTEGDELYAIVPPNEQGTVTVYPSTMSETGEYVDDKSNPLFEGLPGEPVIVQCNLGDFYSNVLVTVTDGGGAIDLRPGLSGEDGRLFKESWLYDFSVYEKPLDETAIEEATQLLLQVEEIKLAMQQGKSIMYTGDMQLINGQTCLLFTLGTGHGEQFVRESYYAVGDDSLYAFDSIYGTWNVLGMG